MTGRMTGRPRVGFIGVGTMGLPMAGHVLAAGFPLVVHDARPEAAAPLLAAGAVWADGPRAVAETADVVLSCLPSVPAVESVAGEVLEGLAPGKALVEMSTNSPKVVARLHAAFAARGAFYLDAPVSGGALGARKARLAIFVGGERSVFDRFAPVLAAIGDRPIHAGASGTGILAKLLDNCASQTLYPILAELFALGLRAGVAPLALWQAMRAGEAGRARVFDGLADGFLTARDTACDGLAGVALSSWPDALAMATALGRDLVVPMRFAELTLADLTEALARGGQDADMVARLPLERLGLPPLAGDAAAIAAILARDPPAASDGRIGRGG